MTTRKAWWEDIDDEDDDTEQAVAVSDKEKGELVPLEEINRKAERGAVLGSVAALISIRALKACQMQEARIEALENVDKPADTPVMPEIMKIGHYEMKTSELLVLPDETLERLLDCAQETLEDPDFSAAVDELLKGEDLPELVAAEAGNDEGE